MLSGQTCQGFVWGSKQRLGCTTNRLSMRLFAQTTMASLADNVASFRNEAFPGRLISPNPPLKTVLCCQLPRPWARVWTANAEGSSDKSSLFPKVCSSGQMCSACDRSYGRSILVVSTVANRSGQTFFCRGKPFLPNVFDRTFFNRLSSQDYRLDQFLKHFGRWIKLWRRTANKSAALKSVTLCQLRTFDPSVPIFQKSFESSVPTTRRKVAAELVAAALVQFQKIDEVNRCSRFLRHLHRPVPTMKREGSEQLNAASAARATSIITSRNRLALLPKIPQKSKN